jgi:hypothetical protein
MIIDGNAKTPNMEILLKVQNFSNFKMQEKRQNRDSKAKCNRILYYSTLPANAAIVVSFEFGGIQIMKTNKNRA